jgi:hypothetical protein
MQRLRIVSTCGVAVLAILSTPLDAQVRFSDHLHAQAAPASPASQKEEIRQKVANGNFKFTHARAANKRGPPPDTSSLLLPHWDSSFKVEGVVYPFSVIGSDPSANQTTTIPTVIVSWRLQFADGTAIDANSDLIDGATALDQMLASPIFHNAPFSSGPTSLGTTQWGDAYLRANFWSLHGGQGSGYHTLLEPVAVIPVTIDVPADIGYTLDFGGERIGFVDFTWMTETTTDVIYGLAIPPSLLTIHAMGEVASVMPTRAGVLGFHWAVDLSAATGVPGVNTFIQAADFPAGSKLTSTSKLVTEGGVLAHEIVEWLMDPLVSTVVPTWRSPSTPNFCWNPLMEVGDPLEFENSYVEVNANARTYLFPDVAFLPWFSRSTKNFSANGWYSLFNRLTGYSQKCPFFDQFVYLYVPHDPGIDMQFTGANTQKEAIGYLTGVDGELGFLFGNIDPFNPGPATFDIVNIPGSFGTYPLKINDSGQIVGVYFDSSGNEHGFLMSMGGYTSIDFPGAIATEARAINSKTAPTIAGDYVDAAGILHAFTLTAGVFQRVDIPFATNAAITGINARNQIVGTWDEGPGSRVRSFIGNLGTISSLDYVESTVVDTLAGGINDAGEVGSTLVDHTTRPIEKALVYGAGDFVPANVSDGADDFQTILNDISNQEYVVGGFSPPDGSGLTAVYGIPYRLYLANRPASQALIPIALPAGAFGSH